MKQRNTIISAIFILLMLSAGSVMGQTPWLNNASGIHYLSGKVGIGTNDPKQLLHLLNQEGYAQLGIHGSQPLSGNAQISQIILKDITAGNLFVNSMRKSNGDIEFLQSAYDASAGLWNEFVYFNFTTHKYEMRHYGDAEFMNHGQVIFSNNGGVSVATNTIATGYDFCVGGKIICEELLIELETNWPDYVFGSNYNLPSLLELESFIAENNHLPNIPSAQDIEKNGVPVGEMNRLLLEKIEELTLYIIQQEKRIDQLESKINNSK